MRSSWKEQVDQNERQTRLGSFQVLYRRLFCIPGGLDNIIYTGIKCGPAKLDLQIKRRENMQVHLNEGCFN